MSAGKSKEGKSSTTRFYSRAAVLMSAVVGGGITIAETQKYHREHQAPKTEISAEAVSDAVPIPLPGAAASVDGDQPLW